MTLVSEQVTRIANILQDTDISPTNIAKIIAAHAESTQKLARRDMFTQIQWINAIVDQALYVLDTPAVDVMYVLYDERVLRYATEQSLDRMLGTWENLSRDPQFWTQNNQNPNTIRIVPAPQHTGSAIPIYPSPLIQDMRDNLVVFYSEDVTTQVDDASDTLPTMLDWDDLLVWQTARMLAERETSTQNLPVAQLCQQLEDLWMQLLQR